MSSGSIGLYNEDSSVNFDNVIMPQIHIKPSCRRIQ